MATAIFIGAAMIAYAINPEVPFLLDDQTTRLLLTLFVVYDIFSGPGGKK